MQDFHEAFSKAKEIISAAAEIVKKQVGTTHVVDTKQDQYNIVTETDTKTEKFLREQLGNAFPDFGFIGEEGELFEKETSWIIDPIDGTVGFEKNLPEFAIVLGLKHQGAMIFSLIYRVYDDCLFTAYLSEGAYRNGERIYAADTSDLKNAVVSISHQNLWFEKYRPFTFQLLPQTRSFRIGFSSAVETTYVAEGKLDGLFKVEQSLWDVAPEVLLASEAGVVTSDGYGNEIIYHWDKESKHSFTLLAPGLARYMEAIYLSKR